MKNIYNFGNDVVKLNKDMNYARINDGNYIPVKHNGKHPYVLKVTTKGNGCPKKVERLILVDK